MRKIKNLLRPGRDIAFTAAGFSYDFLRQFRHGGWRHATEDAKREFKAVKIYHRLEKSLSFRNRKPGAGHSAVRDLTEFLEKLSRRRAPAGFHETVAYNVLSQFEPDCASSRRERALTNQSADHLGGVIDLTSRDLTQGKLDDPERFFLSRYSVRDFSNRKISDESIFRALRMAQKSPSVCNRQAWHMYHLDDRELIDQALRFQNGNRGFGHEIPCLLIVAVDLRAFDTAGERYQHWIDGGMFSMSLVSALHSLGIASCCLNWSKVIADDIKLRRVLPIAPSHSVVMMLAVGYAKDDLKVCYSARPSIESIYTKIKS